MILALTFTTDLFYRRQEAEATLLGSLGFLVFTGCFAAALFICFRNSALFQTSECGAAAERSQHHSREDKLAPLYEGVGGVAIAVHFRGDLNLVGIGEHELVAGKLPASSLFRAVRIGKRIALVVEERQHTAVPRSDLAQHNDRDIVRTGRSFDLLNLYVESDTASLGDQDVVNTVSILCDICVGSVLRIHNADNLIAIH